MGASEMPKMRVHPAAEIFPIDEADLDALVDDIAEHGQRESIKVAANADGELTVVDGRTRLAACERLGIEPVIETLPTGIDLDAYVVSVNLTRRNLTAGQRAMALAMIYPEAKRGRGNKDDALKGEETSGFRRQLQIARDVRKAMPEIAAAILRGEAKLDAAYQQVLEMRRQSNTVESRVLRLPSDLRARVREDELSLDEAESEVSERDERERRAAKAAMSTFMELVRAANAFALDDSAEKLLEARQRFPQEFADICRPPFNGFDEAVRVSLPSAAKKLAAIVKELSK